MNNKKGFTLVEILLVFALIAIISTAAISNGINSSRTFAFLSSYKNTMNSIRAARSYAITNVHMPQEGVADSILEGTRYGVMVRETDLSVFADVGDTPYELDISGGKDVFLDLLTVNLSTNYTISVGAPLTLPIYLYFEPGTGDLSAYDSGGLLDERCISFGFSDGDKLTKHIVIFAISGLPEAFDNAQEC